MIMLTIFIRLLAVALSLPQHAVASINSAMVKKPLLRQSTLSVSRSLEPRNDTSNDTLPFSFVSSSENYSEVRCKDVDGPTRSVSLAYSYLIESSGDDMDLEVIDKALLYALGERVLECTKPDGQLHPRVVALGSRLYTQVSDNYCKSGFNCVIVRRKMTLVVDGVNPEVVLATVYSAIEATIDRLTFEKQIVTFISNKTSLVTRAQSFSEVASKEDGVKIEISIFVLVFIVISVLGFLVAILFIAMRRKGDVNLGDLESAIPVPISIPESLSNDNPSERCREISPVNLDTARFASASEFASKTI